MSPLEDQIRGALHAEATRLREMPPLDLSAGAAQHKPRPAPHVPRTRRPLTWWGPLAAVAAIVLVAAALVTVKSLVGAKPAQPTAAVASPSPTARPALPNGATPRYYVMLGSVGTSSGQDIIVGDDQRGNLSDFGLQAQTAQTIASFPFLRGNTFTSLTVSGAANDRTFVVSGASIGTANAVPGSSSPTVWYLVRLSPGSSHPAQFTRLPIEIPADSWVATTALSGDGTELAVLSAVGSATPSARTITLGVYSVATGRLLRSWSAPASYTVSTASRTNTAIHQPAAISDLSWVGDTTVGFAVTTTAKVSEEVRTLNVNPGGTSLLSDSHVVWSQYVPAPHGARTPTTPQTCDTPYLTGNGQAVVCGNFTYSTSTKRLTTQWLAYPLETPTQPRVLGSVLEPTAINSFNGNIGVEWSNQSGTELIGNWNPEQPVTNAAGKTIGGEVHNLNAFVGNGTVRQFPWATELEIAW
jgi:hypothetical protein